MSEGSTNLNLDVLINNLCQQDLLAFVRYVLDKSIKKDNPTKLAVFFTALSAFTEDPLNLFLKGESSSGKTYNAVEVLKFFPKDHVWILGNLSPKALIHERGKLITPQGKILDPEFDRPQRSQFETDNLYEEAVEKWKQLVKDSSFYIDLNRKILLFLEIPEYETFRLLYPILSHDSKRIEYRFVDKNAKGQLKTTKVIVEGYPATIFLSTDRKYVEELATRSLTATPEVSTTKILEAFKHLNRQCTYPWFYADADIEDQLLRRFIERICWMTPKIIIPFPNLHEIFGAKISRDMRDFKHFLQLVKAITFLHLPQRERLEIGGQEYLPASIRDVAAALDIFSAIIETTRTGTEERILKFYHDVVSKRDEWRTSELVAEFNKDSIKTVSSKTIRRWMDRLVELGYCDIKTDPTDARSNLYIVLSKETVDFIKKSVDLATLGKIGFDEFLRDAKQPIKISDNLKTALTDLNGHQNIVWAEVMSTFYQSPFYPSNCQKEQEKMDIQQMSIILEEGQNQPLNQQKETKNMDINPLSIFSNSVERKEDLTLPLPKKPIKELVPSIPCPLCSCVFASEGDLQNHLKGWHKKTP